MSPQPELVIRGAHSSPYSRKMRAVLRYRHIPHQWVVRGMKGDDMPDGAVPVIPVIGWRNDDGSYRRGADDFYCGIRSSWVNKQIKKRRHVKDLKVDSLQLYSSGGACWAAAEPPIC